MEIIYCGLHFDQYDSARGPGFEYANFYLTLKNMAGVNVVEYPFDRILTAGREKFNYGLLEIARRERPELIFFFMLSDELEKNVLEELKKMTTTVAWFTDDSWRFYNYSKFWARHFTWAVTTYSYMPELYRESGQRNVIRSQWAANTKIYTPRRQKPASRIPDVSFVGGWSRSRAKIVNALQEVGIRIETYGSGWPNGRVSQEEMMNIFSDSKINLALNPAPGYFNKNSLGRLLFRRSVDKIVPDLHLISNFQSWLHRGVPQIKARHFEIPACGGFLLTSMADDLANYYVPGKEISIYDGTSDLIQKIKYYLANDDERKAIASAGYERTAREHTYEKRFGEIFRATGFPSAR